MSRLLKVAAAMALALSLLAIPRASFAGVFVGISVNFGPPPLPVYVQPPCPAQNLIWTPGYWAYGPYGYYWVPGTWVAAPEVGYLWTPGYWGYNNGYYGWNDGYWGPQVGYYGGINYGYGYSGNGYYGGRWRGNQFAYNTAYSRVNRQYVRNVYVNRVANNSYGNAGNRVSYNGGRGGINARPNANQLAYARQRHIGLTSVQRQHVRVAASNRNYLATVNRGRPANVAFARPLSSARRPANFAPIAARNRTAKSTTHTTASAYHARTAYRSPSATSRTYHAAATTYHAPVHAYHAAATTYHAPVHTYHAATTYHAPVHTYHAATTTYHAPAATYHAPVRPYRAPVAAYHAPVRTFSAGRAGGGGGHPGGGGGGGHPGGGHPEHH